MSSAPQRPHFACTSRAVASSRAGVSFEPWLSRPDLIRPDFILPCDGDGAADIGGGGGGGGGCGGGERCEGAGAPPASALGTRHVPAHH